MRIETPGQSICWCLEKLGMANLCLCRLEPGVANRPGLSLSTMADGTQGISIFLPNCIVATGSRIPTPNPISDLAFPTIPITICWILLTTPTLQFCIGSVVLKRESYMSRDPIMSQPLHGKNKSESIDWLDF